MPKNRAGSARMTRKEALRASRPTNTAATRAHFLLFLPLLVDLLSSFASAQQQQVPLVFDCAAGCPVNGPIVCAIADPSLQFASACLAACQDIPATPCARERRAGQEPPPPAALIATRADQTQYPGFVLVRYTQAISPSDHATPDYVPSTESSEVDLRAVRRSAEGWEYKETAPNVRRRQRELETLQELIQHQPRESDATITSDETRDRHLTVLGADTRRAVLPTTRAPYSSVVVMDYNSNTPGGCSGVLISRYAIVTAAHCLWDKENLRYKSHEKVAPARYKVGNNPFDPYGKWSVRDITVFSQYLNSADASYDIAVVTYKPRTQGLTCFSYYPGDAAGFVTAVDSVARSEELVGYPDDRLNEQITSGTCTQYDLVAGNTVVHHNCDTAFGSSGSPMLVGGNTVVAVHGFTTGTYNGGIRLRAEILASVNAWAEVDVTRPSCDSGGLICRSFLCGGK